MKLMSFMFVAGLFLSGCTASNNTVVTIYNKGLVSKASIRSDQTVAYHYVEDANQSSENGEVDTIQEESEIESKLPLLEVDIEAFKAISFYRATLNDRYVSYQQSYPELTAESVVLAVNMGIDQPFYSQIETIQNTNDSTLLINKFFALPNGYEPSDLVSTPYICTVGVHYACSGSSLQYVRSEVADPFIKLVEAAKAVNIDLYSISSYRTYAYQDSLYTNNYNANGQEYADYNFARPGHSEHNTGLALDVGMNNWNFNEIHFAPEYPWLVENMANYGFILRYPYGKTDITGFGYEPWHLRYVGVELAQEITNNQWTLEEYYARVIAN